MNKNKIFGWMMVLGLLVFGGLTAEAQRTSGENREKWEIIVTNAPNPREGYGYTINSQGTFGKVETQDGGKTHKRKAEMLKEEDLQEIGDLVLKLNLAKTTSETIAGRDKDNFPYWSVSIDVGYKGYMIEGAFLSDMKIRVLTNDQKAIYAELKVKLKEIGVVLPQQADVASVNSLNLPMGFSLPLNPAEQKMLFQFEYWKSTDSFQHRGWYMDESGKIYKYSYDLNKNAQNPTSYDFKFKMLPTLVAQANLDELAKWREVLKKIERGKYTEKQVTFDKGTAAVCAFLLDSETGKYRKLNLASIGDYEGINDAPEVEELILWLKSVVPAD